jgi:CheY-like chemotaxis protein
MNRKILIVEDEDDAIEFIAMRLEREGYEIMSAHNGLAGLAMLREVRPDLVIADVMMPLMDGYTFCRTIKNDPKFRSIPVILLTARGQADDRRIGKEVNADGYIAKPFDGNQLIWEIKRLLVMKVKPDT